MKESIKIAAAFVGVIVGAGFASGQEIMHYFTRFGWVSMYGSFIAMLLFTYLGLQIGKLGAAQKATSHKQLIYKIAGGPLGVALDIFLMLLLFTVVIVMFAGAGALSEQMLQLPAFYGQLFLAILTMLTLMLNINKIFTIIAAIIPFFLFITIIVVVYALWSLDFSHFEMHSTLKEVKPQNSHWLMSAILYVSYNIALGFSMLAVLGGTASSQQTAARGGLLGGILLGIFIVLLNIAMLMKFDVSHNQQLPLLALAKDAHPILGSILSLILFGKMYNTAVGSLFAFNARLMPPHTKGFKWLILCSCFAAFLFSFVGFTTLVAKLYSIMGLIGFILIFAMIKFTFKKPKGDTNEYSRNHDKTY